MLTQKNKKSRYTRSGFFCAFLVFSPKNYRELLRSRGNYEADFFLSLPTPNFRYQKRNTLMTEQQKELAQLFRKKYSEPKLSFKRISLKKGEVYELSHGEKKPLPMQLLQDLGLPTGAMSKRMSYEDWRKAVGESEPQPVEIIVQEGIKWKEAQKYLKTLQGQSFTASGMSFTVTAKSIRKHLFLANEERLSCIMNIVAIMKVAFPVNATFQKINTPQLEKPHLAEKNEYIEGYYRFASQVEIVEKTKSRMMLYVFTLEQLKDGRILYSGRLENEKPS
jgi:hypothetical protein